MPLVLKPPLIVIFLKDLKMLFITALFLVVLVLLAYALSTDKGVNTVHARRNNTKMVGKPVQAMAKTESKALHAN